jgi:predicted DNA binding CopG/RHH family protein
MNNLDPEEKEILETFEMGKLKRPENAEREIAKHRKTAEATFRKDASIHIHISPKDLRALQVRTMREGVSYQTLVSSVLHKYVDGQLVEKTANE